MALGGLRRAGVDLGLVRHVERPTGCAAIMVAAGGENTIAVASGANAGVEARQVPPELLGAGTLLVAQMEVPVAQTAALLRQVQARGGRCLLNYAPALPIDRAVLRDADIVVANEGEAAALGPDLGALARDLRQALVVTRGAAGAVAYLADGTRLSVPALPIEPIDTTGAGDAFVGVLAAALNSGSRLDSALRRASAAAGYPALPEAPKPPCRMRSRSTERWRSCRASGTNLTLDTPTPSLVLPAKAGTQGNIRHTCTLDPRLRGCNPIPKKSSSSRIWVPDAV